MIRPRAMIKSTVHRAGVSLPSGLGSSSERLPRGGGNEHRRRSLVTRRREGSIRVRLSQSGILSPIPRRAPTTPPERRSTGEHPCNVAASEELISRHLGCIAAGANWRPTKQRAEIEQSRDQRAESREPTGRVPVIGYRNTPNRPGARRGEARLCAPSPGSLSENITASALAAAN